MENTLSVKQQLILEAAQELFSENGFDNTSVRDIAKKAGVNVAMISYYFGSKEKLFEKIFLHYAENVRLQLESLVENESLTPAQKMEYLIEQYVEKYFARQAYHRLLMREQLSSKSTPTHDTILEMKLSNTLLLKRLILDGQKKGDFKKNVDVSLMTATILGTANQLMTTQKFFKEIQGLETLSEDEYRLHLKKKLTAHLKSLLKALLYNETPKTSPFDKQKGRLNSLSLTEGR